MALVEDANLVPLAALTLVTSDGVAEGELLRASDLFERKLGSSHIVLEELLPHANLRGWALAFRVIHPELDGLLADLLFADGQDVAVEYLGEPIIAQADQGSPVSGNGSVFPAISRRRRLYCCRVSLRPTMTTSASVTS